MFGAPWGGVRAASAQEQSLYIAFSDFNAAPVTDMTRDDIVIQWDGVPCEIVLDAVGVLASEGGAATFFDALYEEAERLEDDREREYLSAVVMVAIGGSEGSRRARGDAVQRTMDRLYDNAAVVHTLLFTAPYGVGRTLGRAQATWGRDIAASTRARYEEMVISTRYRTLLPEIAADLARRHRLTRNQYRVTYRPPEDASDQPRLQVGSARVDVVAMPTDNGNVP